MKLTEKQIEEIADNLDCGMRCFYNRKTGEIKAFLDSDSWIEADDDEELWEEEANEIDANRADFFEFDRFDSHESFQIMEDFAESIENNGLRKKLINALNKPKPFQNFKWQIDNAGEYRQQWFDFKKTAIFSGLKTRLI